MDRRNCLDSYNIVHTLEMAILIFLYIRMQKYTGVYNLGIIRNEF